MAAFASFRMGRAQASVRYRFVATSLRQAVSVRVRSCRTQTVYDAAAGAGASVQSCPERIASAEAASIVCNASKIPC